MEAAMQGGACLVELLQEPRWLDLCEYLWKRGLEAPAFSIDLKYLCVQPLPAAPRQLLLSAAAWEDEMRPHF